MFVFYRHRMCNLFKVFLSLYIPDKHLPYVDNRCKRVDKITNRLANTPVSKSYKNLVLLYVFCIYNFMQLYAADEFAFEFPNN